MENTITNTEEKTFLGTEEQRLVDYLENQISNTIGFIKRTENSIDILNEEEEFATAVSDIIGEKMEEVICYRFRLDWLQNQKMSINDVALNRWVNKVV